MRDQYQRFHARRQRMLLDVLARHVPAKLDRCLDIGGGGDVGGVSETLRERFAREFHGVDQGVDVGLGHEKGVASRECDVDSEPLPYADGWFDLVILASVIEHLYNPHHVADEIARVLKPGGLLLVEAPSAVALGRRLDALAGKNPFGQFNTYNALENKAALAHCALLYTPEEVETLLAPQFEVIDRGYGMHTPAVSRLKALLRELAFRVNPRLADCFYVVARRK